MIDAKTLREKAAQARGIASRTPRPSGYLLAIADHFEAEAARMEAERSRIERSHGSTDPGPFTRECETGTGEPEMHEDNFVRTRRHRPLPPRPLGSALDQKRQEQLDRLDRQIAAIEQEAPPPNSARSKVLDVLRANRAELQRKR